MTEEENVIKAIKYTGRMRWLHGSFDHDQTLQQECEALVGVGAKARFEKIWEDVPSYRAE